MSFVRATLDYIVDPYVRTYGKVQQYNKDYRQTANQLAADKARLQHANNLLRGGKRVLTLKILAKDTLNPSWWNIFRWRLVRYFFGSRDDDIRRDELNDQISDLKTRIVNIEYCQFTLSTQIQLNEKIVQPVNLVLKLSAIAQLTGLVAGTVFACCTAAAFLSTAGLNAIVLTGILSIPVLIFHDTYYMAKNVEDSVNGTCMITPVSGVVMRLFLRLFIKESDSLADDTIRDLVDSVISVIEKDTVLLHTFQRPVSDNLVKFINKIME